MASIAFGHVQYNARVYRTRVSKDPARVRRAAVVFGTRPEAIKLAPVIHELARRGHWSSYVLVTGQHREMLDPVLSLFGIEPQADLSAMRPGQSLAAMTADLTARLPAALIEARADVVFVQGDTTTTFTAALASFYAGIPCVHVEAGLRTGSRGDPYPEEMNRRLTTQLAAAHMAPTPLARSHLLADGVPAASIFVTGNTVIDALMAVSRGETPGQAPAPDPASRVLLVTCHRRESWGPALEEIAGALADIASRHPDLRIVLPLHLNPVVRRPLVAALEGFANVSLCEPLEYDELVALLARCFLVLTDSGGLQEEAPALGKPVLVMRQRTERPEAIAAGTARLVGTTRAGIAAAVSELVDDELLYARMANAVNPYGDGRAAQRTVDATEYWLGMRAEPPEDFVP